MERAGKKSIKSGQVSQELKMKEFELSVLQRENPNNWQSEKSLNT